MNILSQHHSVCQLHPHSASHHLDEAIEEGLFETAVVRGVTTLNGRVELLGVAHQHELLAAESETTRKDLNIHVLNKLQ